MPRRRGDEWPDDVRMEVQAKADRIARETERLEVDNLNGNREGVAKRNMLINRLAWDIVKIAREK